MRRPKLTVYLDAGGAWRWRLRGANGRTVADSGEAYSDRREAIRAAHALFRIVPIAVLTASPD